MARGNRRKKHPTLSRAEVLEMADKAKLTDECFELDHHFTSTGYLKIVEHGREFRLNRLVLEHKLGRPIQPGMQANHTCDNRQCINPNHIYEGTQKSNFMDMVKAGTNTFKSPWRVR